MKQISSAQTFFLKFVFSGLFLAVAVRVIDIFVSGLLRAPKEVPVGGALFAILWCGFVIGSVYYFSLPLKKVSVDDRHLYVSNYFKEIVVPLVEVERIEDLRTWNIRPIVVHLKSRTAFGSKIKFVPQTEFNWGLREHSTVVELREAVEKAKAKSLSTTQPNYGINRTRDQVASYHSRFVLAGYARR